MGAEGGSKKTCVDFLEKLLVHVGAFFSRNFYTNDGLAGRSPWSSILSSCVAYMLSKDSSSCVLHP